MEHEQMAPLCHFERSEKSRPPAQGSTFLPATLYRKKEETARWRTRFLTAFEMTKGGHVLISNNCRITYADFPSLAWY
jgi:hypothetical protein